jgi:hypothetical protein
MAIAKKSSRSSISISASMFRAFLLISFIMATVIVSGCVKEPEVCDYNGVCIQSETDNCADCQDVLGRDVKDPTGNVIYIDNEDYGDVIENPANINNNTV